MSFIALGSFLTPQSQAYEMEGTCDGADKCKVTINGDQINTSTGINISSDNIIGWSFSNSSKRGGFFPGYRNEDYRILIKYFDKSGKRKINQIGFYNAKTTHNFLTSLELISGLGVNHDQAGVTTKCSARGKDSNTGKDGKSTLFGVNGVTTNGGAFSLKKNFISDTRSVPANSNSFSDDSFTGRDDCVDEPKVGPLEIKNVN
ncbi:MULTISPECIES: hypothetical protein [Prochlorococcus]|nr:hypothetical protein [Prochlorococcus marinus]